MNGAHGPPGAATEESVALYRREKAKRGLEYVARYGAFPPPQKKRERQETTRTRGRPLSECKFSKVTPESVATGIGRAVRQITHRPCTPDLINRIAYILIRSVVPSWPARCLSERQAQRAGYMMGFLTTPTTAERETGRRNQFRGLIDQARRSLRDDLTDTSIGRKAATRTEGTCG